MRSALSVLLLLLGFLLMFPAAIALWEQRTLDDSGQFTRLSNEILTDPRVQDAAAKTIVRQIQVEVPEIPARLQGKVDLDKVVAEVVDRVADSRLSAKALGATYQVLKALSNEDESHIKTSSDDVILDLSPAITDVTAAIEKRVPELKGRVALPPDAGRIVLARDSDISLALKSYRLVRAVAPLLIVLPFGAFALALLVARRRPAAVIWVGCLIVAGALVRVALLAGPLASVVRKAIAGDALYSEAGVATYETLARSFVRQDLVILVAGAGIAFVGFLLRAWVRRSSRVVTAASA